MAVTDPETRIERMLSAAETAFAEQFTLALALVKSSIKLDDLATLLEQGRIAEAFASLNSAASRLNVVWAEQFVSSGTQTGKWLQKNVGEIIIGFDQTNHRAVATMQRNGLRMVSNFTEQQRRATQQALIDGMRRGLNPRDTARAFRDSIGLTPMQERWVRNYEEQLRNLDRGALRRELRDRRFDRSIERAIERGEPLTRDQITKMTERYRARALKMRAETIARTESLKVVHEGTKEMYNQAIDNGDLQRDQLIRIWNTAKDERVRDSHNFMHNQERQHGELFASGNGNQTDIPGGFGIAEEDIQCRCVVSTRITNLNEIPNNVGIVVTQ